MPILPRLAFSQHSDEVSELNTKLFTVFMCVYVCGDGKRKLKTPANC